MGHFTLVEFGVGLLFSYLSTFVVGSGALRGIRGGLVLTCLQRQDKPMVQGLQVLVRRLPVCNQCQVG